MEASVVNMISSRMFPRAFSKGQDVLSPDILADTLWVVKQGLVSYLGRVISKGGVFGESMLHSCFRGQKYNCEDSGTTLCFSVLFGISADDMVACFNRFPQLREMLYKRWIRWVFRQHVVAYAIAKLRAEGQAHYKLGQVTPVSGQLVQHYSDKLAMLDRFLTLLVGDVKVLIRIQAWTRRFLARRRQEVSASGDIQQEVKLLHSKLNQMMERETSRDTMLKDIKQAMLELLQNRND